MKLLFVFLILISSAALADFRFTYNNHTYDVITRGLSWGTALEDAASRRAFGAIGYLARIDDADENAEITSQLSNQIPSVNFDNTQANDGGGASYVWLGANDDATEGKWIWSDNNQQFWQGDASGSPVNGLYNNWGNEPDNFSGTQNAAAIAITEWPLGSGSLGSIGQWNDLDFSTSLYYIIEYDAVESQLDNISTRGYISNTDSLDQKMIAGFIVDSSNKELLISVYGPTLTSFGVSNVVADPSFIIVDSAGNTVVQNDNWANASAVSATNQAPTDDLEPALVHTFEAGSYTVIVSAATGQSGEIVVGVQDYHSILTSPPAVAPNDGALINISTRGYIANTDASEQKMIAGFIVDSGEKQLLIAAYGPTLAEFNVENFVADPSFQVFDSEGNVVAENDNWNDDPAVVATTQAPHNASEAALVHTFSAGSYTVVVSAAQDNEGEVTVGINNYDSVVIQ